MPKQDTSNMVQVARVAYEMGYGHGFDRGKSTGSIPGSPQDPGGVEHAEPSAYKEQTPPAYLFPAGTDMSFVDLQAVWTAPWKQGFEDGWLDGYAAGFAGAWTDVTPPQWTFPIQGGAPVFDPRFRYAGPRAPGFDQAGGQGSGTGDAQPADKPRSSNVLIWLGVAAALAVGAYVVLRNEPAESETA